MAVDRIAFKEAPESVIGRGGNPQYLYAEILWFDDSPNKQTFAVMFSPDKAEYMKETLYEAAKAKYASMIEEKEGL